MARTPILAREEASHVLKKYLAKWGGKGERCQTMPLKL